MASALQGACATVQPPSTEPAPCPKHEAASARVEFQEPGFDGQSLSGRLLLGAVDGSLCVDRRLIESFTLNVERVLDCATGQPLGFLIVDVRAPPRRAEDVLLLEPGQWYGRNVSVPLFSPSGPGPGCIDVELSVHTLDTPNVGALRVRAMRAPSGFPDAGPSPVHESQP
ncbi:MAG: hypothetical protein EOO71_32325 [Myxococcaceae bacterium]|nr:MAG: hypothetical protein EOO71_32325 [Myxococcaceae bacterium]